MAYRKSSRNKSFTVIYNEVAQHNAMSMEARGLLLFMLSLPDDWDFHKSWLQDQCPGWGRDKLAKILKELETLGYLIRTARRSEDQRRLEGWDWEVLSESSAEPEERQIRHSESDSRISSHTENQSLCKSAPTKEIDITKQTAGSRKPEQAQARRSLDFETVLAWVTEQLEGAYQLNAVDHAFLRACLEEYRDTATHPSKGRALAWVERGLKNRIDTDRRSQQASAARDQKVTAVVNQLQSQADALNQKTRTQQNQRTRKSTIEQLTDTSWNKDNWLDQLEEQYDL